MKNMKFRNDRGSALLLTFFVGLVVSILAFVLYTLSMKEMALAERQRKRVTALHIAEAGIERAIFDLRQDFISSYSWTDGDINGQVFVLNNNFQVMPYADTTLNNGTYTVMLKNGDRPRDIWIKSSGVFESMTQTIQVYASIQRYSIWDNAIFAGSGQNGGVIKGNVNVAGSVHVLGDALTSTDFAIDLNGTATLAANNYSALDTALRNRLPPLENIVFDGDNVETLRSHLRVKNGQVNLGGTGQIGETNVAGNAFKETADAAFVEDGIVETSGPTNVHVDRRGLYDLGNMFSFPLLGSDEDPDSYASFFKSQAYQVIDAAELAQLAAITPESVFAIGDENGMIAMDGEGHLLVSGCLYIEGDLKLKTNPDGIKTITYQGTASILAEDGIVINSGLVTPDTTDSFPTSNILGFMTPQKIVLGEKAQKDVMGLFYAEDDIKVSKQTNIIGTLVSNYFDLSQQVPSVFQVPATVDHLPPHMIGSDPFYLFRIVSWKRI